MSLTISKNKAAISSLDQFGFGLPTISIVSTELISDSTTLQAKQDPHIDHPGEISVKSLSKIDDANENRSLIVKLRMSFKEIIDPDGDFSYISEGKDLKYFKVVVFQSLKEEATSTCDFTTLNPGSGTYFKNTDSIVGLSKKVTSIASGLPNVVNLALDEVQSAKQSNSNIDLTADNLIDRIPLAKTQDSFGNILYDIPLMLDFEVTPKEGGTKPNHLAYFAFAYFDIEEYLQEVQDSIGKFLDAETPLMQNALQIDSLAMGNISSDIIILNGQLQQEAYVLEDGNGDYYTGPYHQMADGQYMKGAYHLQKAYDQSEYLKKVTVPNSKIIDNREVAKLDKVDYNYAKVADFLINPDTVQNIAQPGTEQFYKLDYPIFSKMWSSRDISGKNRFLFSINMESLLIKNTSFPGLLTSLKKSQQSGNGVIYSSLLSQVQIKEMTITRRRVKRFINPDSSSERKSFTNSDNPIVIVTSKDENGTLKSKVETSNKLEQKVTINQKKVGAISEVNIDKMSTEVRTFSCTDINVSEKNSGLYEYSLEMEFSDPVTLFLRGKIQELEILLNGTNSSKGWNDYLSDVTDSNYFDKYSNRFNVEFLDFYNSKYNNTENLTFVSDIIFKFVALISQLDAQNSLNKPGAIIKAADFMIQISDPNTGNPQGVQTVADYMNSTISSLQKLLENSTSYKKLSTLEGVSDPHTINSTPNIAGVSAAKTIRISHTFKDLFQAFNTTRNDPHGYDFLSTQSNAQPANLGGLRQIFIDDYVDRCTLETKKLFLNEDINFNLNSPDGTPLNTGDSLKNRKFCFLSPSFVYVPKRRPGNLISNEITISEASDLVLDIIRYNQDVSLFSSQGGNLNLTNSSKPLQLSIPRESQSRRFDLIDYLSSRGATFKVEEPPTNLPQGETTNDTFSSKAAFLKPVEKDLIDEFISESSNIFLTNSKNILNSNVNPNKFLTAMVMYKEMDYNVPTLKAGNHNRITYYNISNSSNGKVFRNFILNQGNQALNNQPNHVKSLILLSENSFDAIGITNPISNYFNTSTNDPFRVAHFFPYINLNYRMLNKIQVFDGYEVISPSLQGLGSTFVCGNGKWKDLNEETMIRVKNAPSTVYYLCRQVRYTDSLSVKIPKILEMPFYDEYFLLTSKELNTIINPDSFEAFFSNDMASGGIVDDIANEQVTNSLFNHLMNKEDKKVSKTSGGGYLKTEFMKTNLVKDSKPSVAPNNVQGANAIFDSTVGQLTENKNKFKAAKKMSLLEQAEVMQSMGLAKYLTGNNVNSNISKLKTDGTANKEGKGLTPEEAELLKKSSNSKQTKEAIDKAIKLKDSKGSSAPMGGGPITSSAQKSKGSAGGFGGGTGGAGATGGGGVY